MLLAKKRRRKGGEEICLSTLPKMQSLNTETYSGDESGEADTGLFSTQSKKQQTKTSLSFNSIRSHHSSFHWRKEDFLVGLFYINLSTFVFLA